MSENAANTDPNSSDAASAMDTANMPFEGLLCELEGVVGKLESGELSLEDALSAYEQGIAYLRHARTRLSDMEGRMEKLTADGRAAPMDGPSS